MNISKSTARKRRLAILRQVGSIAGENFACPSGVQYVSQPPETPRFDVACQAALPLRLVVRDERTGKSEEVLIERPFLVVGSNESCDIHLRHAEVSQRHAYLQVLNGRLFGCDLSSRTGTHWGNEIQSRNWLNPGEAMFVGPYSIRLAGNDFSEGPGLATSSLTARPSPAADEVPIVRLNFLNALSRSGKSRISRIKRCVTLVGWSHVCNLRLQHSTVGRVHCSLVWTPQGMWVVDLLCRGGTRINGMLIRSGRLEKGDELGVGRFRFQVDYDAGESSAELIPSDSTASHPAAVAPQLNRPGADSRSVLSIVPGSRSALSAGAMSSPEAIGRSNSESGQPLNLAFPQVSTMAAQFPQATGLPVPGSSDSMALALMQQFSMMQQQLFDHTQQLMTVMVQAFNTAHSRQLELIKGELNLVHELNFELQRLNIQRGGAAAGSEQASQAAVDDAATAASEGNASAVRSPSPSASLSSFSQARDRARRAGRRDRKSQFAREESAEREESATTGVGPLPADEAISDGSNAAGLTPSAEGANSQPNSPDVPVAGDVHAWLSGRINELEQERSSRWQKILQLLTPGSGG